MLFNFGLACRRRQLPTMRLLALVGLCAILPVLGLAQATEDSLKLLTKSSTWELIQSTPLQFASHHPQGLVKIGDHFFMSSVETSESPRKISDPQSNFDRTSGAGIGHLFKFAQDGTLLDDLIVGEGDMYHPGGIDFDGEFIWVSVAEYRPNSQSIVYKIDPTTMRATEVFRFADHLGGIVKDPESGALYAMSWGSRKFYRWDLNAEAKQQQYTASSAAMLPNHHHYIDYQDCQWRAPHSMLCSGVSTYGSGAEDGFKLGGIELRELPGFQVAMQLPITRTTDAGVVLTQNPFYFETNSLHEAIMYFVPEDDSSTLFSYRVTP